MLVKSYSISPVRLQRIVVKALFLRFCKVSIDHLFDNLESGKKIYCFGKSLEFWIQKSVRTLIILERVHSISTYFSVFVCMIPKRHFVHVQVIPESVFIPVFNPNEILVLVWDFILVSCKMKEDFVLNWNRKPSSLGQVAHAYLIWR